MSALSANFFNYWDFKIVVDPLNGNMKVIDTHSTPYLTSDSKRYTKYQGDPPSTNPPSHVVNNLGIYKYQKFLKSRVRLFGKIGCYLMSKKNSVEIDDKFDLKIARKL